MENLFDVIDAGNGHIIKAWKRGVPFEEAAIEQLKRTASMPFVFKHLAAMPDCHLGVGATIGTVLPTLNACIPSAVGVDIGCGMIAQRFTFTRAELEAVGLAKVRAAIEKAVPCGRTNNGGPGDRGAWGTVPNDVQSVWDRDFCNEYELMCAKHPGARARNTVTQLGTLGTGNHFIELSEDESGHVWLVLHSGSRGLGNKIGTYFTDVAKDLCKKWFITLPDPDLAYLPIDTQEFKDYKEAVTLAQRFAWDNRLLMVDNIQHVLSDVMHEVQGLQWGPIEEVHCHHNYISWERHFGENIMVTRKGAVRVQKGERGIIPGSMGARTYIVEGLGNRESFCTCSHGAGRAMGRRQAERTFTVAEHAAATAGIECDKSADTLDETPKAYKDIEAVMAAQSDIVTPLYILKQFLNVKGKK
jgi:tRNA-splicing ligase RtcB (3'-phosphate/5'-hydroxy nucleic acid ligase)